MALLLLPLAMSSCWVTSPVKTVRWHAYTFQLAVSDGGGTTSFNWQVTAHYPGFFGTREKTVFEAYGGPFLKDMRVEDGILVLLANDGHVQPERIELDLQHLDALLDSPVRYQRFTLTQRNAYYHEPAFIQAARELEQQLDFESAKRRQQQETGHN